jgi:hypothetical protein
MVTLDRLGRVDRLAWVPDVDYSSHRRLPSPIEVSQHAYQRMHLLEDVEQMEKASQHYSVAVLMLESVDCNHLDVDVHWWLHQ